jgi:hypothetical protein
MTYRTHEEKRAAQHDKELHPKIEDAIAHDKKIRDTVALMGRTYIVLAKLFEEADQKRYWHVLGFDSCREYIQDRTGASRSGVYLAIGLVRELAGDVPDHELEKIPLSNAQTLAYAPGKVRSDPAMIRAAQEMPAKDFRNHMDRRCPTLHIKEIRSVHVDWWLDKTLNDKWEEAMEKGRRILSTESKNVVLEAMIALFLETPDDVLLQAHQHEGPDISEAAEVEA